MIEQELIDKFVDNLMVNHHYSKETKKSYLEDIDNFVSFLSKNGFTRASQLEHSILVLNFNVFIFL